MLLKLWPIIRFQLDQFLHESSIFVLLIDCIRPPCNRGVAIFSHVGPYYFPCFQERHNPPVFHLNYFLFFFIDVTESWVRWIDLSAFWISKILSNLLPCGPVLFIALGTCQSSSASFSMVSIFLAFEVPQGWRDILFNLLKTIANLRLLESMGLVKCQDVWCWSGFVLRFFF